MDRFTTSTAPKLCVIIPAYNEARFVDKVVARVKAAAPTAAVVVVNDGSTDNTGHVARASGAAVINLPFNLGIGGAVQTGLKYAARGGYDVAIEVDADGQHDPTFIPHLLTSLADSQADLVIGSRFVTTSGYHQTMMRSLGITLFSILIRLVRGHTVYDSTSGFRAYSRRAVTFLAPRYPSDFPEPESIVMLLNNGFRIHEVSVLMQPRQAGVSSLQGDFSFRAAYFVVSNAIAIVISAFKRKLA